MSAALAARLRVDLEEAYRSLAPSGPYVPDAAGSARRALRMTALGLLSRVEGPDRAAALFETADNMTEKLGAFAVLVEAGAAKGALSRFYDDWQTTPGVLDKWFGMQVAYAPPKKAVDVAEHLTRHPDFDWHVPNRVRAVLGSLLRNHPGFHARDGRGYRAMASWIRKLDPINPQTAARFVSPLGRWRRIEPKRAALMKGELERIAKAENLSRDTFEQVSRSLEG